MPSNPRDVNLEKIPHNSKIVLGSIAGMISSTIFHPLDLLKVRLQVYDKPETSSRMADKVVKCDGLKALYRGLSASILRQATYTPSRLAAYYFLYDEYVEQYHKPPTLNDKVVFGVASGLFGAFVGNPSEVALVRLMADGPNGPCCPRGNKRRYGGLVDLFSKIMRKEGIQALWRGGLLTSIRTVFLSIIQIETYGHARQAFKKQGVESEIELHLYTSVLTSLVTACTSLPVDVVKTLYQVRTDNMTQREIWSCLAKRRGVLYFWKGFFPYFTRLAFHTFITFYILEQLCDIYRYVNNYNRKPE